MDEGDGRRGGGAERKGARRRDVSALALGTRLGVRAEDNAGVRGEISADRYEWWAHPRAGGHLSYSLDGDDAVGGEALEGVRQGFRRVETSSKANMARHGSDTRIMALVLENARG